MDPATLIELIKESAYSKKMMNPDYNFFVIEYSGDGIECLYSSDEKREVIFYLESLAKANKDMRNIVVFDFDKKELDPSMIWTVKASKKQF